MTKSCNASSQRQGEQHQLNQRERAKKRGEKQTEERDQKKKTGIREEKENTETNAETTKHRRRKLGPKDLLSRDEN